jgi:hypothetical protein
MANWGSLWFRKMARQKQMVSKMARHKQMVSKMSGNPSAWQGRRNFLNMCFKNIESCLENLQGSWRLFAKI